MGGFVGGVTALIKGENVWTGVKSGAASGMVIGAGTDLIAAGILSGGTITYATIGLLSGIAGETTYQSNTYIDRHGSLEGFELDREAVLRAGVVGGMVNMIATPASNMVNDVFTQDIENKIVKSIARNQLRFTGTVTVETAIYAGGQVLGGGSTKSSADAWHKRIRQKSTKKNAARSWNEAIRQKPQTNHPIPKKITQKDINDVNNWMKERAKNDIEFRLLMGRYI